MESNTIITIGRQFGSGGHEVGRELAKELGLKIYDKELLKLIAEESGNQQVYQAQFDTIKKLGQTGGCVIVGRAADYILREYKNLTTVFVHASLDYRIQRVAEFEKITDAKAKDMILKADKKRASFYNFQTDKKWGAVSSYNLSVDTSDLGIEGAVKLIKNYIEIKNAK